MPATYYGWLQVTSDVEAFISRRPGSSSLGDIAHALTAKGYICRERRATGGGEGSVCLHNLRHTCLVVILPTPHDVGNNKFIVDATFVEQFEIAKPTDRYSRLLRCVPPVLVFPEDSICLLVQFLCVEMSSAFRAMGAVLPPWRKVDSMLSKWLPRQLEVGLAAGTPLEPNAAALPTQLQLEVPRFVLGKPDSDPPQLLMPQHKARSIATTSQRHVEPVRICGGFSNMRVAGLLP